MEIGPVRQSYTVEPILALEAAWPSRQARAVVPDYAEPVMGWRSWFLVRVDGRPRLCSPCYWTIWEPARATAASCRRHGEPDEACVCGICASLSAREAAPFLICPSRGRVRAVGRVLGRVALWGKVVECERGWRGALAYPADIFIPMASRRPAGEGTGRGRAFRWWQPRYLPLTTDEVALALRDYRVPVRFVEAESIGALAEALDVAFAGHGLARASGDSAAFPESATVLTPH